MFDIDEFLIECRLARAETEPRRAIKDVLQRAMSDGQAVADAFAPTDGGIDVLFQSSELTVLNVVWVPKMTIYPHDHRMWAAIGIYTGQEDNSFYRRTPTAPRTLTSSGGKSLAAGDVVVLGDDTIHGVTNPLDRLTGAIHIYGGDFVNQERSQWGAGDGEEHPYDLDESQRQFEQANAAWRDRVTS